MYECFYQFRERPFALSPDPEYLYPSSVHRMGLDYLRYGIEGHAGFVVVTGEIGSGKTTLLQTLLRTLDAETTVARLFNTILEPRELLEAIMLDLGVDTTGMSKPVLLRELARILVQQRSQGRRVILVIDEAQNLSLPSLEEVRMLSNFETEKSKLIQIILVGQPELRDTLALPQLEQLRQRVTVTHHIQPLDVIETGAYINHRLRRAALGPPLQFTRDVTDLVYAGSHGVPRMINVICDSTLLFGYSDERRIIDPSLVRSVLHELETTGVLTRAPSDISPTAGGTTAVAMEAHSHEHPPPDRAPEPAADVGWISFREDKPSSPTMPQPLALPLHERPQPASFVRCRVEPGHTVMSPRAERAGEREATRNHVAEDRACLERPPNGAGELATSRVNRTPEQSAVRGIRAPAASPISPGPADELVLTHTATPVAASPISPGLADELVLTHTATPVAASPISPSLADELVLTRTATPVAASPISPGLADELVLTRTATPVAAAWHQAPATRRRSDPPSIWERCKRLMLDVPGTELKDPL